MLWQVHRGNNMTVQQQASKCQYLDVTTMAMTPPHNNTNHQHGINMQNMCVFFLRTAEEVAKL